LTKRALKPGGIVSQWIPLHSQAETHVYQNFRTFYESFPYVMAWYPVRKELILIGSNRPINIDFHSIEQRLQNPVINKIMRDINFGTPYSFLGSIWFLKNELKRMGTGKRIISDNNPSLEFFLNFPKGISTDDIDKIVTNRASFEDVWGKITKPSLSLSKAQKVTFKKHWDSRLNSEYAEAHNNLGNALSAEGKIEEAISHYKMAIGLNPDFAEAHNNLGILLFNAKMTEEAIDYFKEAIRIRPGFAAAQKNLETALRSMEIQDLF